MRGLSLFAGVALIATAALAQPAQEAVAPRELTGKIAFTRKPTGEAISAVRSERVVRERVSGGAVLDCRVTAAGALAECNVAAEAPLDYGFGASALRVADQYRVAAHTESGEATAGARVRVPVTFNAARVGGAMTLMAYPIWVEAPSLEQVEAAYPAATAKGATGKAVVRCAFDIEGRTTDCEVLSQTPVDRGFGAAALKLIDDFVVLHTADDADVLPGVIADIPIAFRKPDAALDKMPDPQWLTEVSASGADELFPLAAREEAVKNGLGTVDCLVTKQGGMTDCRVAREEPADLGFGAAAMQVAQQMRINAWSPDGRAYGGRRLTVPIRMRQVNPRLEGKPVWLSQPSAKDMANLRPRGAGKAKLAGGAVLNCIVGETGYLAGCTIENESPKGLDFGAAVLETAPLFRMAPKTERGFTTAGTRVKVPVNFTAEP